jgi:hypothetical protein
MPPTAYQAARGDAAREVGRRPEQRGQDAGVAGGLHADRVIVVARLSGRNLLLGPVELRDPLEVPAE